MTRAELRQAMKAKRSALRETVKLLRRQTAERVDQVPAVQRERRRRRVRRAVGTALVALLLLFIRCDCEGEPPAAPVEIEVAAPPVVKPKPKVAPPAKPKPLHATTEPQPRPGYEGGARLPPKWVDEFRLAVSARSTRLATCFNGTDRPGALRWTTSVNPETGKVSDHELEPVGPPTDFAVWIGSTQRDCLIKALSTPPYQLTVPKEEALPDRVSLVIEF